MERHPDQPHLQYPIPFGPASQTKKKKLYCPFRTVSSGAFSVPRGVSLSSRRLGHTGPCSSRIDTVPSLNFSGDDEQLKRTAIKDKKDYSHGAIIAERQRVDWNYHGTGCEWRLRYFGAKPDAAKQTGSFLGTTASRAFLIMRAMCVGR